MCCVTSPVPYNSSRANSRPDVAIPSREVISAAAIPSRDKRSAAPSLAANVPPKACICIGLIPLTSCPYISVCANARPSLPASSTSSSLRSSKALPSLASRAPNVPPNACICMGLMPLTSWPYSSV